MIPIQDMNIILVISNIEIICFFAIQTCIVTPHSNHLIEMVLMRGHKIFFIEKLEK